MKVATLRRGRTEGLGGISGVARLDRRTKRLVGRLNPGDIAIIDHVDLDRVAAEALVAAEVTVVINAQPSISGRFPNLGPDLLIERGVTLLDNVGAEIFAAVKEGTRVRVDGDTVYLGEQAVAKGTLQTADTVAASMTEAKAGMSSVLEAFAVDTKEYMSQERALLLEGVGIPEVRTKFVGRHCLIVVRGYDYKKDLAALKHYIREFKPVLVGVDGGADALREAGYTPHLIVGDMDAVSDEALRCGAEVVAHSYPDGRTPGMNRVQDLGIDAVLFPANGTSEDLAMLLADDKHAELIVAVGSHATLDEFLDSGRGVMASTFLTRLRLGGKLIDGKTVNRLYRNRISSAALLLLVLAALVAVVAALAVSQTGRDHFDVITNGWHHVVHWIKDVFS